MTAHSHNFNFVCMIHMTCKVAADFFAGKPENLAAGLLHVVVMYYSLVNCLLAFILRRLQEVQNVSYYGRVRRN
jgi:hypothetical protein